MVKVPVIMRAPAPIRDPIYIETDLVDQFCRAALVKYQLDSLPGPVQSRIIQAMKQLNKTGYTNGFRKGLRSK